MASSKAHAVQTSAHASVPVEPDMFAAELQAETVKAFRYIGRCKRDAFATLQQIEGHAEPVPVVLLDLECGHEGLSFSIRGPLIFPVGQMVAAQAKAAHCRKGTTVQLDGSPLGIRINFDVVQRVQILESTPS